MAANNQSWEEQMVSKVNLRTSLGIDFQANRCSNAKSWRLVHDGKQVQDFFESSGYTTTINNLFEGTQQQGLDEITRLGLAYTTEDLREQQIA